MDHNELPSFSYSAKCSCGWFSAGVKEDPALFSDHLRALAIEQAR